MATFFEEASGLHCRITVVGAKYFLFIEDKQVFVSESGPNTIIQQMMMNPKMGHEKWDAHYPAPGQGYRFVPAFEKWQPE